MISPVDTAFPSRLLGVLGRLRVLPGSSTAFLAVVWTYPFMGALTWSWVAEEYTSCTQTSATPSLVGTSPGHISNHSIPTVVRTDRRAQRRCCGASKDSEARSKRRTSWDRVPGAGPLRPKHCLGRMNLGQEPPPVYGTRRCRHIKSLRGSLERKQEGGLTRLVASLECQPEFRPHSLCSKRPGGVCTEVGSRARADRRR